MRRASSFADYKETLKALAGLGIIVAAFYGAWIVAGRLLSGVLQLDAKTRTTVLTVSGTIVSAVLTIMLGQYFARAKEIRESQRPQKIEIYRKIINLSVDYLHARLSERQEVEMAPPSLEPQLRALLPDLIMWASPGVINACQKIGVTTYYSERDALNDVEQIFREMRKDIGLNNAGLVETGILNVAFRRK